MALGCGNLFPFSVFNYTVKVANAFQAPQVVAYHLFLQKIRVFELSTWYSDRCIVSVAMVS